MFIHRHTDTGCQDNSPPQFAVIHSSKMLSSRQKHQAARQEFIKDKIAKAKARKESSRRRSQANHPSPNPPIIQSAHFHAQSNPQQQVMFSSISVPMEMYHPNFQSQTTYMNNPQQQVLFSGNISVPMEMYHPNFQSQTAYMNNPQQQFTFPIPIPHYNPGSHSSRSENTTTSFNGGTSGNPPASHRGSERSFSTNTCQDFVHHTSPYFTDSFHENNMFPNDSRSLRQQYNRSSLVQRNSGDAFQVPEHQRTNALNPENARQYNKDSSSNRLLETRSTWGLDSNRDLGHTGTGLGKNMFPSGSRKGSGFMPSQSTNVVQGTTGNTPSCRNSLTDAQQPILPRTTPESANRTLSGNVLPKSLMRDGIPWAPMGNAQQRSHSLLSKTHDGAEATKNIPLRERREDSEETWNGCMKIDEIVTLESSNTFPGPKMAARDEPNVIDQPSSLDTISEAASFVVKSKQKLSPRSRVSPVIESTTQCTTVSQSRIQRPEIATSTTKMSLTTGETATPPVNVAAHQDGGREYLRDQINQVVNMISRSPDQMLRIGYTVRHSWTVTTDQVKTFGSECWYTNATFRLLISVTTIPSNYVIIPSDIGSEIIPISLEVTDYILILHRPHHWAVMHIKPRGVRKPSWEFEYYDSLRPIPTGEQQAGAEEIHSMQLKAIQEACWNTWKSQLRGNHRRVPGNYRLLHPKMMPCPQQEDSSSCGPTAWHVVLSLLALEMPQVSFEPIETRIRHVETVRQSVTDAFSHAQKQVASHTQSVADAFSHVQKQVASHTQSGSGNHSYSNPQNMISWIEDTSVGATASVTDESTGSLQQSPSSTDLDRWEILPTEDGLNGARALHQSIKNIFSPLSMPSPQYTEVLQAIQAVPEPVEYEDVPSKKGFGNNRFHAYQIACAAHKFQLHLHVVKRENETQGRVMTFIKNPNVFPPVFIYHARNHWQGLKERDYTLLQRYRPCDSSEQGGSDTWTDR